MRSPARVVLDAARSIGVLLVLAILVNARQTLSWVGNGTSRESLKAESDSWRRQALEGAAWMAPGIPMTSRLEMISQDRSRLFRYWKLPEAIDALAGSIANEPVPERLVSMLTRLAMLQMQLGRVDDALDSLDRAGGIVTAREFPPASTLAQQVNYWRGVAYLRLGERDNCVGNHSAESCILPIRGGGVYKEKRGPLGAIAAFEQVLEHHPEHISARWLLNVSYMNLGEWPDAVPAGQLIPPETFESDADIGRFVNVAPMLGLDTMSLSGGAIMEDFDNDGFLDIVVSALGPRDPLKYFRNDGRGGFVDQTSAAGLDGQVSALNMTHADYDNDGLPDIYVIRGAWAGLTGLHPDSLLHNDGPDPATGIVHFTDVTEQAGLLAFLPSQTASWGDYDNDGRLDLFVGTEASAGVTSPCLLFHNDGPDPASGIVRFSERGAGVGLDHVGFVKGTAWGDYDNDGRLDLYVSQLEAPNVLYHNDGPVTGTAGGWRFSDATARAGVGLPVSSFPTIWFDYDNDGWLDLFAPSRSANAASEVDASDADPLHMIVAWQLGLSQDMEPPRLYRNRGDGTFSDVTEQMGLARPIYAMGMNFGDADNDGWMDIAVGTGNPGLATLVPNLLFRNDGARRFQDITTSAGFGNLQKGHGIAWGDIDNDGDQDILEELGAAWPADVAANALFLNPGQGNGWVTLRLEGLRDNASAIGARIKIVVQRPGGETRDIHVTAGTGGSFGSSSLQQEIGLGDARRIVRIEVFWPAAGETQILTNVPMRAILLVRQGEPETRVILSSRVRFPLEQALDVHHHHMAPVN